MNKIDLTTIPTIGWITFIIVGCLLAGIIIFTVIYLNNLLSKKNLKTKIFELNEPIKKEIKERYIAEGKDVIDNQAQVAKLMLKTARIRIYEVGLKLFGFPDEKDKIIFELITYRISDRLNYELKNDFTRNHIVNKSDSELEQYALAKTKAYYRLLTEKLYMFNSKLPEYDLPLIMNQLSFEEAKKLFTEIYFSGRDIVGYNKKINQEDKEND